MRFTLIMLVICLISGNPMAITFATVAFIADLLEV